MMPPLTLTNTAAATLRFVRRRREQVETQARLRVAALASAASVAVLALRERRRKTPGKAPFVSRARPLAKFILRKTMHDLTAMLTDSAFKLKYRVTKQVFAKIHADILPLIEGHAKGSRCWGRLRSFMRLLRRRASWCDACRAERKEDGRLGCGSCEDGTVK